MISKKINKSEELIFLSPNYLKLVESKPAIKKSLPLVSPKTASKISSVKLLHKPVKKQSKPSIHNMETATSATNLKTVTNIESRSKRNKNRMIISHLSSGRLRNDSSQDVELRKATTSRNILSGRLKHLPQLHQNSQAQQKYESLLLKSQKVLKRYSSKLQKANQEIEKLRQENAVLKRKLNAR